MKITDLKKFAADSGIELEDQDVMKDKAINSINAKYGNNPEHIKKKFDAILEETEKEMYRIYLQYEAKYGGKVFRLFINHLIETGKIKKLENAGAILGDNFKLFDKFFLSMAQSRKSRAGGAFEDILKAFFKKLNYSFTEQPIINGQPDFVMPSIEHYKRNAMDCIIFTSKRTIRERWRQIVTEGTRGLGFYLATIDDAVPSSQLAEMLKHRIYLVVPKRVQAKNYSHAQNVLNFTQFLEDYLDPKVKLWKKNKII